MCKEIQWKIIRFIRENRILSDSKRYVLAISGGPDSMFLLDVLCAAHDDAPARFVVSYVHHGLRKNSDRELEFVRNQAQERNLVFAYRKIWVARKRAESLEESARNARYRALADIALRRGCSGIVTAHTLDDQAETIFLNLLYGAGSRGLCGMAPRSVRKDLGNLEILRPALYISRREVIEYNRQRHIPFMTDESNADCRFRRNLIRNKIFPLFEKINPRFKENVVRAARILGDEYAFMESAACKAASRIQLSGSQVRLPAKDFFKMHPAVQRIFLRKTINLLSCAQYGHNFATIEEIRTAITMRKLPFFHQGAGLTVFGSGDMLIFKLMRASQGAPRRIQPRRLRIPGVAEIPELGITIRAEITPFCRAYLRNRSTMTAYLDSDALGRTAILCEAMPQHRFKPLGMKQTITIKKFLKTHRDRQKLPLPLVLVSRKRIAWLVGNQISDDFKITKPGKIIKVRVYRTSVDSIRSKI